MAHAPASPRETLMTLAIGAAGAAAALALGLPVPFLLGPAIAVAAGTLLGLPLGFPDWLRAATFVVIGVSMGAGVTPEALATAAAWPISLVVLALAVTIILIGGAWALTRFLRLEPMTAVMMAVPGHLSFVLSLSETLGRDLPRIATVQALRVFVLMLMVPIFAPLLSDGPVPSLPPMPPPMPWPSLLALLAAATVLGLLLNRLSVPAGLILGGLGLSAVLHGAGLATGGVPPWLGVPALALLGALLGTRFRGLTPAVLRVASGAGLLLTGVAMAVSLAAAALISRLLGLPFLDALIAFAPGGLESMMVLALLLGADPAYVALHHVFRLLFLSVLLPIVVARLRQSMSREEG